MRSPHSSVYLQLRGGERGKNKQEAMGRGVLSSQCMPAMLSEFFKGIYFLLKEF